MILRSLPDPEKTKPRNGVPTYSDHHLFVENIKDSFTYPEHFTGLGIVTMLSGTAGISINGSLVELNPDSFLIINRGSRLAIKDGKKGSTLALIYFNTILSELVSGNIFKLEKEKIAFDNLHDFSLIEHVHYKNATLRDYLPLLINLGSSCASFYALKADMLLRTILDHVVAENYSAFRCASNLSVAKSSTRITLYQRLSIVKEWLKVNFYEPVTADQMADVAMLNRYHFLRSFKKAFGITPHQHLTDIRIAEARELLRKNVLSISEICYQVGFSSLSSFSLLFKERCGVSPSAFRQLHKNVNFQ
ncbi:Transcriptional regulator, AraC family [Fulvivirga imtechensis AK7]|uniref:Transcriptional regulator, AraC family n=1 Tax=Fulvivirga imtechensis AK7 TaxID=1237149 RepID=L8JT97_9BACT|nr:helix-turn-helix domain-containing protein [Fulvivirga imtechensis]ELR72201.1 Transcriptional regulator, AraC family [Fulvivirga imtechensis AK7]